MVVFLLLVGSRIWNAGWAESMLFLIASYVLFSAALLWSLLTVGARYRLSRSHEIVARLSRRTDDLMKDRVRQILANAAK